MANSTPLSPVQLNRRTFRWVCACLTAAFVIYGMLQVTVPLMALQSAASPFYLGIIFSAPYLLPLFLALPAASILKNLGGRFLLISGGILLSIGILIFSVMPGIVALFLGQMLTGFAQLLLVLAAQTMIAELGEGGFSESYYSWYTTWISVGQVCGPLIAGTFLTASNQFQFVFVVMAIFSTLVLLFALTIKPINNDKSEIKVDSIPFHQPFVLLKQHKGFQVSIGITVTAMFCLSIHSTFFPVYLQQVGLSAVVIGFLVSLRSFSSMLVRPMLPTLSILLGGRKRLILCSLLSVALGLLSLSTGSGLILLALISILVGVGSGLSQPLSLVILAEQVEKAQRPGALALRLMSNRGISFLAPLIFGFMLSQADFPAAFFCSGLMTLTAIFFVNSILNKLRDQQTNAY